MLDQDSVPGCGARSDRYFEYLCGPDFELPQPPNANRLTGLLKTLLPKRKFPDNPIQIDDHEERAAFVCCLTALCVVARCYVAVGDKNNGYIILPPAASPGAPG